MCPGLKDGNVFVTADGSLKIKDAVVENSGRRRDETERGLKEGDRYNYENERDINCTLNVL